MGLAVGKLAVGVGVDSAVVGVTEPDLTTSHSISNPDLVTFKSVTNLTVVTDPSISISFGAPQPQYSTPSITNLSKWQSHLAGSILNLLEKFKINLVVSESPWSCQEQSRLSP